MTKNQIDYQRNVETSRANRATESLREAELGETRRSNQARETETQRANVAKETETHRSNIANEFLTASRDSESARANRAREFETHRSNLANEVETRRSHVANELEAERSHLASELETNRANVVKEGETKRHNEETERLQGQKQVYDYDSALKATEGQRYAADKRYEAAVDSAKLREEGANARQTQKIFADTIQEGIKSLGGVVKTFVQLN